MFDGEWDCKNYPEFSDTIGLLGVTDVYHRHVTLLGHCVRVTKHDSGDLSSKLISTQGGVASEHGR